MTGFRALLLAALFAPVTAGALELDEHPEISAFIDQMAAKHEFVPAELRRWFGRVEIRNDIIEAMQRPREALPWWQYKKTFVTDDQARRGAAYWGKHARLLQDAAEEFGVAPEIIVAIIGVETQYGRNTGRHTVLEALTTLAFAYPPRADYFRKELEEFLLLAREQQLGPMVKGSYAGAIGIGQFMPSSYRAYAVDFDKDSTRDLFESTADAIGSVGNYFRAHGWRTGAPVIGVPLDGGERLVSVAASDLTLQQLRKHGVSLGGDAGESDPLTLIRLEEETGPRYLIGYHNFRVITRYNRSHHYAMAVYELAQMIRGLYVKEPVFPLGPP